MAINFLPRNNAIRLTTTVTDSLTGDAIADAIITATIKTEGDVTLATSATFSYSGDGEYTQSFDLRTTSLALNTHYYLVIGASNYALQWKELFRAEDRPLVGTGGTAGSRDSGQPTQVSITSAAQPTIDTDICSFFDITALATDITSMSANLTGSPKNGQRLTIRIRSTADHAIVWGASYEAAGASLPVFVGANMYVTVGLIYSTSRSLWGCVAVSPTSGPQIAYGVDSGSTDDYAVTITPAPSAYTAGMMVLFKANTANTGACTLAVNTLAAKSIKKKHDQDPANNDIESGQIVTVIYDGTNFQMQSQIAN